jgi:hypothetical protein
MPILITLCGVSKQRDPIRNQISRALKDAPYADQVGFLTPIPEVIGIRCDPRAYIHNHDHYS